MAIRCVAFDLGGVILKIHFDWSAAMASAGFEPREKGGLPDCPATSIYGQQECSYESYLEGLRDYLELKTTDDAAKVHDAILDREYVGAKDLLDRLKAKGLLVGCLTNTNVRHYEVFMAKFPACQAFDRVVASFEERVNKPDPRFFSVFEHRMGCDAHEIVYFDDLESNVKAAEDAGWRAFVVDRYSETGPQITAALAQVGIRV